ncbi:MAG: DEAD/DEAH box helicase [Flavobacteriales bacterium]|nr:DEAD/DEAH box helicase [Flavobacteriales bacterium]
MTFKELELIPSILQSLQEEGYERPTPIQTQAIPAALHGRDVLGGAQTGTGKTAAFAIPVIQQIVKNSERNADQKNPLALIVTPTRELAIQIGESFNIYGKYTPVKSTVIFGGVKQNAQTQALRRRPQVVIATPGRLLDLLDQEFIRLTDIQYFVLDEADRMLDMGFINDIKRIIKLLPRKRQSLFFSATMPKKILKLSQEILYKPKRVEVTPVSSTAETITQKLYTTNRKLKLKLLLYLLEDPDMDQVLVFSRTKRGADRIVKDLRKNKIECGAIHGDKSQHQRQRALNEFKESRIRLLVATDIAARGIDIDKLKYVINYDVPNESETYVHRIGRCGRAGEEGLSISLCEPEENAYVLDIEKLIGQKIEVVHDHPFPQTDKPMTAEEKKEFEREKQKRKREFFANRNKKRQQGGTNSGRKRGKKNSSRR